MNKRPLLLSLALSFVVAVVTAITVVFIYDQYRIKDIETSYQSDARFVVENEVLVSENFKRLFTSSSPTDFTDAALLGVKSVVYVRSIKNGPLQSIQTGSGVILTSDGYIITNYHVIADAERIEITLDDKRTLVGKVIGTDEFTDLAVLKIEAEHLPYVMMYDSDSLRVGEWVLAIGNPFKLQSTVTAGIVSAKHRNLNLLSNQGIESYIQTDAAINHGNSGGALLNTDGKLVGISSAIVSNSGNYEGFSFAVPVNIVRKVFTDIKNYGVVQRGWLGIEIENVDQKVADEFKLNNIKGVRIVSVNKNGSASDASMKIDDVICAINTKSIGSISEFMEYLATFKPGDKISVEYVRDGMKKQAQLILKNHINTSEEIAIFKDGILKILGLEIRDMDGLEKAVLAQHGVKVVSVTWNGPCGKSKMEPNYIITKINNQPISSAKDCILKFTELKGEVVVLEGFYQDYPGEFPYTFRVPVQ